jgi:DNA transformation protein and related proteins
MHADGRKDARGEIGTTTHPFVSLVVRGSRNPRQSATMTKKQARKSGSPGSLKVSDAFKTFVIEQLSDLDDLVARAMFGGVGLYERGVFFGIMAHDRLYLKVDELTRPDYARVGARPFKPYPDRSGTMQYYEVPVNVLESAQDLTDWARKAVAAAKRGHEHTK